MPLALCAKLATTVQAFGSLAVLGLVIARAVNILKKPDPVSDSSERLFRRRVTVDARCEHVESEPEGQPCRDVPPITLPHRVQVARLTQSRNDSSPAVLLYLDR
jgi:hypothetical protein